MNERDIPSVPVTTLAGLTSLSDLLSELPVSDSLSNVTSLNKSLLFHTLVANESHNLLSVRDENLVRQLVHAIEQTNSDNIDLKSQYAIQQHVTNISTYPELLQGIYTYRPTVFNTPQTHRQQNVNTQQHQKQKSSGANAINNQQVQSEEYERKFSVPNNIMVQPGISCAGANTPLVTVDSSTLPQQPQILQQLIISPSLSPQNDLTTNSVIYQAASQQISGDASTRRTRRQTGITPATITPDNKITQTSSPQRSHDGDSYLQQFNVKNTTKNQHPQTTSAQFNQLHLEQQNISHLSQSDQTVNYQNKKQVAQQTPVIQQQLPPVIQQRQQLPTQQLSSLGQHQKQTVAAISQLSELNQKSVITYTEEQNAIQPSSPNCAQISTSWQVMQQTQSQHQNVSTSASTSFQSYTQAQAVQNLTQQFMENPTTPRVAQQIIEHKEQAGTPIIQGQFQNVLNLQKQQLVQKQLSQKLQQIANLQIEQQYKNIDSSANISSGQASMISVPNQKQDFQNLKVEKQEEDERTLPLMRQEYEQPSSTRKQLDDDSSTNMAKHQRSGAKLRVCINRLKAEDSCVMQQSIKEFVKKSPELAKKMGLTEPGQFVPPLRIETPSTTKNGDNLLKSESVIHSRTIESTPVSDTFTIMKADEKRVGCKRKSLLTEVLPPEQIFSKPKVRRVERILSAPSPKCSKEEVMRSQTYQQFMRNMEQIIELLDDTETPNFDSDDVDESVECISSKMLNTISNDVAKLKAKMVLDSIPKNKLTLLINYTMRNIYLAKNYSAGPDDEDEMIDDEVMEKILNAMEACLLICNIYSTVKDLKFLQEDNISVIIKFVQYQFRETIYPSYDPVYTVKNMKKDQRKKTKAHHSHNRQLQLLYSKSVELMKVFVTLFDKCIFVDTIVLPLSTLAIEPFFVDNIDTLQFVCLELVTTIFRKEKYDKIRSSILGDILSSIDRLPSSKKNLRPFKLTNNCGNIQMVTALVLQLIQCATILPDIIYEPITSTGNKSRSKIILEIDEEGAKVDKHNKDVLVLKKYDVAVSIGGNFLTTFLNKCKTRSNETDFRPLFENFIHDLLATVNKPEWPASELLLSLLGTMLVKYVSDKSIEQSIRLVSLDYLGIVTARLRKDIVESRCKVNIIDSMISCIKAEQEKEGDTPDINSNIQLDPEEERTEFLQKILLDFLAVNAQEEDCIWDYARHFYLTQWYRDIIYQRRRIAEGGKGYASRKKKTAKKKRRKGDLSASSSEADSSTGSGDDEEDPLKNSSSKSNRVNNEPATTTDQELNLEIYHALDERKSYLLSKIKIDASPLDTINTSQHIKTYIDYNNAHLIAQYLATKRPFSQSFDIYLKKIILVVNEPSIAVRTRAMKCLANIVEVDPLVLKRKDMQMGVNQKFLDAAISVREAAVDLVGKFVLSNDELIDQYYDMLSTRILDTGVSVRKRVIKILRDICIDYPDFEKIPEICVKMIRRVNDEEGIQKLVTEVFMKMWFTPCKDNDRHGIQRKINQIIDVVNTAHDTGTTWLEGLLTSIFTPKENMTKPDGSIQETVKKNTEPAAEIVTACQQLADGLVERLIELEDTDNARMLGCITTLHLLAKVRPQLLIRHAITIEPYLNIKCHSAIAPKFICAVADILEQVVPLIVNPSETFLASLEEHLMLLVVSLNQAVVTSCVSCLGALVNKITKNYKLIRDCFQKFYRILEHSRKQVEQNLQTIESIYTPIFRRSLFTIGILMRYFDFKSNKVIGENGLSPQICDETFETLMYFNQCSNYEIRKQSLIALGSYCVMNDDYLTRVELKRFYCDLLRSDKIEGCIKIICMRNIWIYLTESEMHMYNKEKDWDKQQLTEDLKEMNDVSSGMASRIIQLYLQNILDCFLNHDETVRLWAVKVVQIVLRQGLVHPVRMVPYLIALSTDPKQETAHRADALLKDIDKTYAGFVNMKVQFGLQLCFKLQEILQCNKDKNNVIRGYVKRESDTSPSSLNDFLYTLLRTTKPQRRALVQTVIKQFDDQKTTLQQMLYITDNLAYFPYVVQDEPLYLIHQIDLMISMAGTNLLATFKECLKPSENANEILEDDDDEEDPEVLFKRLPEDTTEIQKCIISAQACMLLLILKQHLKDMYSLTDGKISRYSPSEMQKIYEKAVTRKTVPDFNPQSIINVIKKASTNSDESRLLVKNEISKEERMDLVTKYLDFKQLMLKLDPADADSADEDADKSKTNNTVVETPTTSTGTANHMLDPNVCATNISCHNAITDTPNANYSSNCTVSTPVQQKNSPITPPSRSTSKTTKSATRKQPTRNKRTKRKFVLSDDEEDDYSDADA